MKKIKYFLLLICSFALVGCFESKSIEYWIDNPTATEIKIAIDGKKLAIPAKSGANYKFESGKHNLSYNNDTVNFNIEPIKSFAIINPTLSNYVIYKIEYKKDSLLGAISDTIKSGSGKKDDINYTTQAIIDGELQEIEAPFMPVNSLFINKDEYKWDYFLDEPIPDSVKLKKFKSKAVKTKIFSEDDFFKHMQDAGLKTKISFLANTKKLSDYSDSEN
ncbi:hypothetical protein [Gilliamella sp. wkB112]|uniref:hypothetical protein n=1 Tax=Gilliamella sp. wkB112 TaxID=3120257 RepID=UPI00080DA57C|nr:hypothetical protein [Gilliamella apicola]OCG00818.1 hypothetical protein A9G12_03370 [Gilliamella apicola]